MADAESFWEESSLSSGSSALFNAREEESLDITGRSSPSCCTKESTKADAETQTNGRYHYQGFIAPELRCYPHHITTLGRPTEGRFPTVPPIAVQDVPRKSGEQGLPGSRDYPIQRP